MKIKHFLFSTSMIFSVLLFSCHPDKSSGSSSKYRVSKSYLYDDNGMINDSSFYHYNNNLISNVSVQGNDNAYYTFEYNSSNKITKRNDFSSSSETTPDGYETVSYNSDGTINEVDHYSGSGTSAIQDGAAKWYYSNSVLVKVTISYNNTGTLTLTDEYDYTYTNKNVTGVTHIDFTSSPADQSSYTYTYDNNSNYFQKIFLQPLLTDQAFESFDSNTVPFLNSVNNIVSVQPDGYSNLPFTYSFDSHQNLVQLNILAKPLIMYFYQSY